MSGEIFTKEKRSELRAEYCLNNGHSHFNSNVLNDYTDYLELRLIQIEANEAKETASNCTMHGVSHRLLTDKEVSTFAAWYRMWYSHPDVGTNAVDALEKWRATLND